jgi:hypothetical protein
MNTLETLAAVSILRERYGVDGVSAYVLRVTRPSH